MLLDVTAIDWPGRTPRFDVVWHFYSTRSKVRVRVKTAVPESDPTVASLTPLYGSAAFMERETHDMYGIGFAGNDDLRPDPAVRGLRRASAAQGLPQGPRAAARAVHRVMSEKGRPERESAPQRAVRRVVLKLPPLTTLPNPVRSLFVPSGDEGPVIVNIGPSHPATHGTVQIIAALDGERIVKTDVHCGYLHRGFEKECEAHTWHQVIPYVDRLNYVSAMINDFAYCDAVETLMGVTITPRCKYLRTLLSEYSRLVDHLTCIAAGLMELGAMTAFLYLVMIRDYMYEHLAQLSGARVTYSYGRIGGLARDLPDGWLTRMEEILDAVRGVRRPRARPRRPQPHLHRPHAQRRRASRPRWRSTTRSPVRCCARPAPRSTCARTRRTSPTPSSISRCRSASTATTTTGTTCACARWTSRCT